MGLPELTVILVAGFACAALIRLMRPLFARYALARPNARSSHKAPTPQGGGVAVVLGGFIALVAAAGLAQTQDLAALAPRPGDELRTPVAGGQLRGKIPPPRRGGKGPPGLEDDQVTVRRNLEQAMKRLVTVGLVA